MAKEQIDETSKEKAKAYLRQAPTDLANQEWATGSKFERGERADMKRHARKGINRIVGIRRAVKKVSEESEIDEGKDREPAHRAETGRPAKDLKAEKYYTSPDRDDRRSERGPPNPPKRKSVKEETEVEEPITEISDLVVHAIDQKPLDFQQSFADLMQQRIEDAVHEKKLEIAAGFAGANTDPREPIDDDDFADPAEDDDWDGTEFEDEEEPEAEVASEEQIDEAPRKAAPAERPVDHKQLHAASAKVKSGRFWKVPKKL